MKKESIVTYVFTLLVQQVYFADAFGETTDCYTFVESVAVAETHACLLFRDVSGVPENNGPRIQCWTHNDISRNSSRDELGGPHSMYRAQLEFGQEAPPAGGPGTELVTGGVGSCYTYEMDGNYGIDCWGNNYSSTRSTFPHSASIGNSAGCVSTNGTVKCWGTTGSDGVIPGEIWSLPLGFEVEVELGGNTNSASRVVVGKRHACAYSNEAGDAYFSRSTVHCWGCSTCTTEQRKRLLGKDSTDLDIISESIHFSHFNETILDLSVGDWHTCILYESFTLNCYGVGSTGQLQQLESAHIPNVSLAGMVTSVASGGNTTCALMIGDEGANQTGIKCWDAHYFGATGVGELPFVPLPRNLSFSSPNAKLSIASQYGCFSVDGSVYCWGGLDELHRAFDFDSKNTINPLQVSSCTTNMTVSLVALVSVASIAPFGILGFSCWAKKKRPKTDATDPRTVTLSNASQESEAVVVAKTRKSSRRKVEATASAAAKQGQDAVAIAIASVANQGQGAVAIATAITPFKTKRMIPQLQAMGVSLAEFFDALSAVNHFPTTILVGDDTSAVREAKMNDICDALHPTVQGLHENSVFICYDDLSNKELARSLMGALQVVVEGKVFCFLENDVPTLNQDAAWIKSSANFLFIVSEKTITSCWCIWELAQALRNEINVVTVVLKNSSKEKMEIFDKLSLTIHKVGDLLKDLAVDSQRPQSEIPRMSDEGGKVHVMEDVTDGNTDTGHVDSADESASGVSDVEIVVVDSQSDSRSSRTSVVSHTSSSSSFGVLSVDSYSDDEVQGAPRGRREQEQFEPAQNFDTVTRLWQPQYTNSFLPVYYRNTKGNLNCFPICLEFGDYAKAVKKGKNHRVNKRRGCLGEVVCDITIPAEGFSPEKDLVVLGKFSIRGEPNRELVDGLVYKRELIDSLSNDSGPYHTGVLGVEQPPKVSQNETIQCRYVLLPKKSTWKFGDRKPKSAAPDGHPWFMFEVFVFVDQYFVSQASNKLSRPSFSDFGNSFGSSLRDSDLLIDFSNNPDPGVDSLNLDMFLRRISSENGSRLLGDQSRRAGRLSSGGNGVPSAPGKDYMLVHHVQSIPFDIQSTTKLKDLVNSKSSGTKKSAKAAGKKKKRTEDTTLSVSGAPSDEVPATRKKHRRKSS